jgi:hypothetical protein
MKNSPYLLLTPHGEHDVSAVRANVRHVQRAHHLLDARQRGGRRDAEDLAVACGVAEQTARTGAGVATVTLLAWIVD